MVSDSSFPILSTRPNIFRSELFVAAQQIENPWFFLYTKDVSEPELPPEISADVKRHMVHMMDNIPPVCDSLLEISRVLHQLGCIYETLPPSPSRDAFTLAPMYRVECSILNLLSAQKKLDHGYSDIEILLAETLQLHFWIGVRGLTPQTKLCGLLNQRLMKALLPLLPAEMALASSVEADVLRQATSNSRRLVAEYVSSCQGQSRSKTSSIVIWALALSNWVSKNASFHGNRCFREPYPTQLMDCIELDDSNVEEVQEFLMIFPRTRNFARES